MFGEVIDLRWEDCDAFARNGHVTALESPQSPLTLIFTCTDATTFCPPSRKTMMSHLRCCKAEVQQFDFTSSPPLTLKVNPFILPYIIQWLKQTWSQRIGVTAVNFVSCLHTFGTPVNSCTPVTLPVSEFCTLLERLSRSSSLTSHVSTQLKGIRDKTANKLGHKTVSNCCALDVVWFTADRKLSPLAVTHRRGHSLTVDHDEASGSDKENRRVSERCCDNKSDMRCTVEVRSGTAHCD